MSIKKLQNNFTTPKQSKRLLEIGVPADSADCYYSNSIPHSKREDYRTLHILPFGSDSTISSLKEIAEEEGGFVIPCWSLGRLIDICLKCSTLEQRQCRFFCNGDDDEYSLIDYIATVLESGVMTNHMDFSKLED